MSLSEGEINRVCNFVRRGSRMLVGRDYAGRQKIKITKGPFGLFSERFECTEADLAVIRHKLGQDQQVKTEANKR